MKQFHSINTLSGVPVFKGGKAKPKRCVFGCFLKVATEMVERTDSVRLFQRGGHKSEKLLCMCWSLP